MPPPQGEDAMEPAGVAEPLEIGAPDRAALRKAAEVLAECGSVQSQRDAVATLVRFQGPLVQQMLQVPVVAGRSVADCLREYCADGRADEMTRRLARDLAGPEVCWPSSCRAPNRASQFREDYREAMSIAKEIVVDITETSDIESAEEGTLGTTAAPDDEPADLRTVLKAESTLDAPVLPGMPRIRSRPAAAANRKKSPVPWVVGQNCAGFIYRGGPETPVECGVMAANAVEVLSAAIARDTRPSVPWEQIRNAPVSQLLAALLPAVARTRHEGHVKAQASLPGQLVAAMVCLSPSAVTSMIAKARRESGKRRAAKTRQRRRQTARGAQEDSSKPPVTLHTMVRVALHNGATGKSHTDFLHAMAQRQLEGFRLGHKYLNRVFPSTVEHIGALALGQLSAKFVHATLPGLGIPSDVELFFDPGTIGKVYRAVRSTVLVTGMVVSDPGSPDGSRAVLIGTPPVSVNAQHLEYDAFKKFLESSPVQFHRRLLRSRLAMATTDGAYVEGEGSRHKATHAVLKHLWADLGLAAKNAWDEFHRWNVVQGRAVKSVGLAVDFFQLTRDLDNVLGFGQGRLLDKQVAVSNNEKWLAGKAPGGTREFVYAAGIPARFLDKWAGFYQAVDLRRDHSEEGRTGHDRFWWIDLGVKLASPAMLVFAAVLVDVYAAMTPHVCLVQKPGVLPDVRARSLTDLRASVLGTQGAIRDLLPWVARFPMLQPYLVARDITLFVSAVLGRRLRKLPRMLAEMFTTGKWCGRAVCITVPEVDHGILQVHNVCQCISVRKAGDPHVTKSGPGKAGRFSKW